MVNMAGATAEPDLKPRGGDTEKLTINLGVVDLGQVDLLVQEGFYSNRTDLIRTAIRNQLALHGDVVKSTVARRTLQLGLQSFSRRSRACACLAPNVGDPGRRPGAHCRRRHA